MDIHQVLEVLSEIETALHKEDRRLGAVHLKVDGDFDLTVGSFNILNEDRKITKVHIEEAHSGHGVLLDEPVTGNPPRGFSINFGSDND